MSVDLESPHTLIFYESPYRLKEFLRDALAVYGNRRAALANDLTKMFEAVTRGTLSELLVYLETNEPRGEYVVVIEGKSVEQTDEDDEERPRTKVNKYPKKDKTYPADGFNQPEMG